MGRMLERLTENFFEALGFKHYQGSPHVDDKKLNVSNGVANPVALRLGSAPEFRMLSHGCCNR